MPESTSPNRLRVSAREAGLAVLAHEIRGALTVISGLSELLRRDDLAESDRQMALEGISRAVTRIDRLLQTALQGEPAGPLGHTPVPLGDLVKRVAEERRSVSGRAITVVLHAQPVVSGLPEALERLFGNLIDNALKYSFADTSVDIEVSQESDRAVVTVADRGPGVPEAQRESIFQPFERAGATDTPGSGLGLAVVEGVATSHGGSAQVLPREGGGSVFRVELPTV